MPVYATYTAYEHLKVGLTIGYYPNGPWSTKKLGVGQITELRLCDTGPCDIKDRNLRTVATCRYKIGIDGKKPTCLVYGSRTAIRYIQDKQFLTLEDFKL